MPKASSRTLTIGTKQLVVHDALETTVWLAPSKVSSFTPTTKVASTFLAGAEMMTRGGPPSMWARALAPSVKKPVDSMTTSTPTSPHGRALGSASLKTLNDLLPIWKPSSVTSTDSPKRPWVESYL